MYQNVQHSGPYKDDTVDFQDFALINSYFLHFVG